MALGNFDGVHRGHQEVIRPIMAVNRLASEPRPVVPSVADLSALNWAQGYSDRHFSLLSQQPGLDLPASSSNQPIATVLTFYPHPQEYFSGQRRPLLTPLNEKALHLKALGVEQLVLLPFDRELASLSPEQFVDTILSGYLKATHVSVGQDFRFGCQRRGTVADLEALACRRGISVSVARLKHQDGERISSSRIRQALTDGNLLLSRRLLGRPYQLVGQVITGDRLGRTLGFPTANLHLPPDKFLPRRGVYGVRVHGLESPSDQGWPSVMNLGCRPTVNGSQLRVEVHLLDWSGDLYGRTLTVEIDHYLRAEQKFESLEQLKQQIQVDCQAAQTALAIGNLA